MTDATDNDTPLPPADARALRRKLLAWYRKHRRDMPWRAAPGEPADPYHVLVSEAMLQQTQVATVIPYFHRFIDRFPTINHLAEADEQDVLTLWQGLGYYRRARHLHAAARAIVDEHDGRVPGTVAELLALPGIGRYTAGAIASIAHGRRAAVVDGNVERVLSRLLLIREPIDATPTKKRVWSIAESLLPKTNPGDYNQAVMELGALVCTPKAPKCFVCPLRTLCRGVQEHDPEKLPVKLPKNKPKPVTHVVIAAERNGKYLVEQRPADGLWPNMWQLPTWEGPLANDGRATVSRRLQGDVPSSATSTPPTHAPVPGAANHAIKPWFTERFGLILTCITTVADFTHQTTHRTIRFVVLHTVVASGRLKPNAGVWRRPDQLNTLPMSNPQRKVLATLDQLS